MNALALSFTDLATEYRQKTGISTALVVSSFVHLLLSSFFIYYYDPFELRTTDGEAQTVLSIELWPTTESAKPVGSVRKAETPNANSVIRKPTEITENVEEQTINAAELIVNSQMMARELTLENIEMDKKFSEHVSSKTFENKIDITASKVEKTEIPRVEFAKIEIFKDYCFKAGISDFSLYFQLFGACEDSAWRPSLEDAPDVHKDPAFLNY